MKAHGKATTPANFLGTFAVPSSCLVNETAKETDMLGWAVTFFIVAIVAGVFGFGGIASASAGIAQILFLACSFSRWWPAPSEVNRRSDMPRRSHGNSEVRKETGQLKGQWKHLEGATKEKWGELTDNELHQAECNADQLVGEIQENYGTSKEDAQKKVDEVLAAH